MALQIHTRNARKDSAAAAAPILEDYSGHQFLSIRLFAVSRVSWGGGGGERVDTMPINKKTSDTMSTHRKSDRYDTDTCIQENSFL